MIFLVRHGEAASGWGDHPDPGLSELGHKQAAATARALQALGAKSAVSSPMQRCRETARAFEQVAACTAVIAPEVSEISTPPNVADRVDWLRSVMQGTWSEAGADYVNWRLAMKTRVESLPAHTVVFTHFVAINALTGLLEGDDRVTHFRPGHASITVLDWQDGQLRVKQLGSEAATQVL